MHKLVTLLARAAVLTVCSLEHATAQTRVTGADLQGLVTDDTGARLPGATVDVVNEETGARRSVMTDANGGYSVRALQVGSYRVAVTISGFAPREIGPVVLSLGSSTVLDVTVSVAGQQYDVVVRAERALGDPQRPGLERLTANTTNFVTSTPRSARRGTAGSLPHSRPGRLTARRCASRIRSRGQKIRRPTFKAPFCRRTTASVATRIDPQDYRWGSARGWNVVRRCTIDRIGWWLQEFPKCLVAWQWQPSSTPRPAGLSTSWPERTSTATAMAAHFPRTAHVPIPRIQHPPSPETAAVCERRPRWTFG